MGFVIMLPLLIYNTFIIIIDQLLTNTYMSNSEVTIFITHTFNSSVTLFILDLFISLFFDLLTFFVIIIHALLKTFKLVATGKKNIVFTKCTDKTIKLQTISTLGLSLKNNEA